MRNSHSEDGFTLLEILIVVSIIVALMALLASNFGAAKNEADIKIAAMQLKRVEQALEFYRLDAGRYPSTEQGLEALVRAPAIEPIPDRYRRGGYLKSDQLDDPWKNPLHYENPGQNNTYAFDLASWGPDGVEGGEGDNADIVNWDTGTVD
jgi:general secretion pathway protein G